MIGQSITKIIPPERINEEHEILSQLRQGNKIEHFETKRMTKTGKLIDISLTSSPIKDSNGKIIGASKIARNISLQKETERLIYENDERFRMAVEMTSLGTWEYDPRALNFVCSQESRRICGMSEAVDPTFAVFLNHIHAEDKNYFLEQLTQAIKPGADGKFDLEIRVHRFNNDDEIRWVHIRAKMFFEDDSVRGRLIGTMLDITEEKNRELELKESVELFQTMADNVPAMIWMSGTDKFEDYFNKTWLQFTGRTREQESNEGWLDAVHPEDVKRCIDTYNASFRGQKRFYSEYRLRRHDGEYRWIADNSVPRFSAEREFLGFISACMDIDDQKRFREKIVESELLFKTISNASPAALWMTNEEGENVFVSDTWLKWTGKNLQEVISKSWMESVSDEDRVSMTTEFRECFQQRKNFKKEFRFLRHDGVIRWGLAEGYPFYDFDGEFSGFAGSVTDITGLKKWNNVKTILLNGQP
jgi:PAS domain S-box-containing protein